MKSKPKPRVDIGDLRGLAGWLMQEIQACERNIRRRKRELAKTEAAIRAWNKVPRLERTKGRRK